MELIAYLIEAAWLALTIAAVASFAHQRRRTRRT